jgi:drug/metabolite transporter (DMT)-like permease
MALATVVLWGASFTVVKSAYAEFTPLGFAAVRFVIASATLLVMLAAMRRPLAIARADLARVAAVGASHIGLYQIFFGVGLQHTTASNSVLLINTAPLMTVALVWLTRSEPIASRQVAGVALAVAGVATLVQASGHISTGHLTGDLITLLAAASYAATPVIVLPLYRRYDTLTVMAGAMLSGTAVLLVAGAPELLRQSWRLTPTAWAQLLYAAVGAGAFGYVFWYEGIRRIGPTRTSAYSYLISPVGVLFAVTVLHEPFGAWHALGGVVILAGVALARWPAARAPDEVTLRTRESRTSS